MTFRLSPRRSLDPVTVVGILLFAGSMMKLGTVIDLSYYRILHSPLSEGTILFRYVGSVGLRILGIIAGIGIVYRKDLCRRLAIGLAVFTIAAIHWKHPLHAFKNVMASQHGQLEALAKLFGKPAPTLEAMQSIAWIPRLAVCATDIAISAFLIVFLTRREISKQFE